MTNLHEPLSDLVAEVPRHLVTDDLARDAWRAGRRRRWRRRAAVAGAVAAVVAVATPVLPQAAEWVRTVEPAGSTPAPAVDGYPERIGHQWWLRDLPDRPGVLAGVLTRTPDDGAAGEFTVVVSESGHQWRIPDAGDRTDNLPTLSGTGRHLGYFVAGQDKPSYVIHDLTTGERTEFDRVEPHDSGAAPYMVHAQTPAFWAPDDSRLLLFGVTRVPGRHLLLGVDGSLSQVDGQGRPVGWVDDEHLAWLDWTERRSGAATAATVAITDTSGAVTRTVELDLPNAFEAGLNQWSGSVSPSGETLALVERSYFSDATAHQFSLEDGSAVAEPVEVYGLSDWCQLGWAGTTPVVPTYPDDAGGGIASLARPADQTLVVADPGIDAFCITLAAHAAAGDPHGLFGTSTAWWTWWWRELVLGAAVVVAGVLGLPWVLRRRRARRS
jgi:hypothetical protein